MIPIDLSYTYFIEKTENILSFHFNDKNSKIDNDLIFDRHIELKDIALFNLLSFEPLSEDMVDVELGGKKQILNTTYFMVLADTDLNALYHFMNKGLHSKFDILSIVRYSEIEEMEKLIKINQPEDITKKGFGSFLKPKKNKLILFLNLETREKVFAYVTLSNQDDNSDFFMNYSNQGFTPALILDDKEVLKLKNEFIQFLNKKHFNFDEESWVNIRGYFPSDLDQNTINNEILIFNQDEEFLLKQLIEENNLTLDDLPQVIDGYKESLYSVFNTFEDEISSFSDVNFLSTFDRISLLRNNKEFLTKLNDFIVYRDNLKIEAIKNKNEIIDDFTEKYAKMFTKLLN